jgi:hypothetical protein
MAGPFKCLCIDKLEESGIIEELYHDADSEEELDGSHISSEDSQENDNSFPVFESTDPVMQVSRNAMR